MYLAGTWSFFLPISFILSPTRSSSSVCMECIPVAGPLKPSPSLTLVKKGGRRRSSLFCFLLSFHQSFLFPVFVWHSGFSLLGSRKKVCVCVCATVIPVDLSAMMSHGSILCYVYISFLSILRFFGILNCNVASRLHYTDTKIPSGVSLYNNKVLGSCFIEDAHFGIGGVVYWSTIFNIYRWAFDTWVPHCRHQKNPEASTRYHKMHTESIK